MRALLAGRIAVLAVAALIGVAAVSCIDTGPPPVEGVVVDIDSTGLADVTGFTIRTDDGEDVGFVVRELENGAEFPPTHLAEHRASGEPVRVWFRTEGDVRVAYRIEDTGEEPPGG